MTEFLFPADLNVRAATKEDAGAIAAGVVACEIAETGKAETLPEHLLELWEAEHTDLASDTCVLLTHDGEIIGYAGVSYSEDGFMLDPHTHVHPARRRPGLESALLRFVEERARRILQEHQVPCIIRTPSFSRAWTARLLQAGYTLVSSDWRMEITLHEAPPEPRKLPGIEIRPYIPGSEERAVHAVVQEAFRDIGGQAERTFEEWREGVLERPYFDPTLLYVALAGDICVGAVVCRSYPEERDVHISQVAVRRAWRRRGIALQLLYAVFGACYRRGLTHLALDVAAHNATGAQQLYLRAGLRKAAQIDNLQKTL